MSCVNKEASSMRHEKTITITSNTREGIRKELVNIFLEEEKGTGKGEDCSHYDYTAEKIPGDYEIHLRRPAVLNKGFDFVVRVPNVSFHDGRQSDVPSHNDVFSDIQIKLSKQPELKEPLKQAIEKVYNCQMLTNKDIAQIPFKTGVPTGVLLAVIKWLFIEQDITYWNWTGRDMLYGGLSNLLQ